MIDYQSEIDDTGLPPESEAYGWLSISIETAIAGIDMINAGDTSSGIDKMELSYDYLDFVFSNLEPDPQ